MGTPTVRDGGTWLITPPSAGRFDAALRAAPTVALLDLEDSVPADGKDSARTAAIGCLTTAAHDTGHATVLGLRLNAPSTLHGLKDLVAVAEAGLRDTVLLVPKVESARDVDLVATVLDASYGQLRIWALIETPRAIQCLTEILGSGCLAGVVFGAADYAAAASCRLGSRGLWYARSALAAGAAAAHLPAIDSPYFELDNPEGLRKDAEEARDLGFTGKGAVHPDQLPIIWEAFRPSAQEVAAARVIVAAADAARGGLTRVHGQMVGPPVVTAARALIARAEEIPGPSNSTEVPGE